MTFRARAASLQGRILQQIRSMKFQLVRLDHGRKLAYGMILLAVFILLATALGPYARYLEHEQAMASLVTRQVTATAEGQYLPAVAKLALPERSTREQLLQRLHALAQEKGIGISQLSFLDSRIGSQSDSLGRNLAKYQISLPADGDYPALCDWLFTLRQEFPTLALEELRLRRNAVTDTAVDARVQLGLYYEDR